MYSPLAKRASVLSFHTLQHPLHYSLPVLRKGTSSKCLPNVLIKRYCATGKRPDDQVPFTTSPVTTSVQQHQSSNIESKRAEEKAKAKDPPEGFEDEYIQAIQSLLGEMEKRYGLRKTPLQLATPPFGPIVASRTATMRAIYDIMAGRMERLQKSMSSYELETGLLDELIPLYAREINILPAISSTSGTAKSSILDDLCNHNHIDQCANPKLKAMLLNSLTYRITFGVPTPFYSDVEKTGDVMLIGRVLFQHFNAGNKYHPFIRRLAPQIAHFSYDEVIGLLKGNKPVLVAVDEVARIANISEKLFEAAVSTVSHAMDAYFDYNCLMTTLNSVMLGKFITQSGRKIEWISVPRPSLVESLDLFNAPHVHEPLHNAILDCGGHLGTLAYLHEIHTEDPDQTYQQLIDKLVEFVPVDFAYSVMKTVLLGIEVALDRPIAPESKVTYNSLVQTGALIKMDRSERKHTFIPTVIPLYLRAWAKKDSSMLAKDLSFLFSQLERLPSLIANRKDNQGGTGFELFVSAWFQLYLHMLGGQTLPISKFFKLGRVNCKDYKITIESEMPLLEVYEEFVKSSANPFENVLKFQHSQKAVDACSGHNVEGTNQAVIFGHQFKFSTKDSSDTLSYEKILYAYNSLCDMIDSSRRRGVHWLQDIEVTPILIVHSLRAVPAFKKALPNNIIILNPDDMSSLFSPSLSIYQDYFQFDKSRMSYTKLFEDSKEAYRKMRSEKDAGSK